MAWSMDPSTNRPSGICESSQIFIGHRALGFVSNRVPLVCRYVQRRRENLIVTVCGRSFHTYGGNKLGLLSVSKIHPGDISVLAADTYLVFTATGKVIYAWRRGSELKHVYIGHTAPVTHLLPFGPTLISVDSKGDLKLWNIKTEEELKTITFPRSTFEITVLCHPNTYKDKILLGSSQGQLKIWNLKTEKQIYKFRGWDSAVSCLAACPSVLDAVAVGLESGDIIVHNLKYDEEFVRFRQDWGPVVSLSFRTDRTDVLVSGSTVGHIAIWDLNDRKLSGQMLNAHQDCVAGLHCLPGEPVLVTSSPDNTLKQWIFDLPDGSGRLLRFKEGHAAPPTKIRFYGGLGETVLSASGDSSLRSFSTVTDLLNKSFGVASYNRKLAKKHRKAHEKTKMNPIVDFTTETTREQEWDNIACVHDQTLVTSTWSFSGQKMGSLLLRHPRFKEVQSLRRTLATSVCLTACGNFVLVGYSSGHVDKFNIQSGIHRGELRDERTGDASEVRAIVSDGLNQLIVVGSAAGFLKFWRFSKHRLLCKPHELEGGIQQMTLHRESNLLAIALEDFTVLIVDVVERNVVRKFECCHDDQITDVAFSFDSRWLFTASLDSTVKVWDVPSGSTVDHVLFPKPVVSLTVSPRGNYLATAHVGDLGIYLWINKSLYTHLALKPLKEGWEPKTIQMPGVMDNLETLGDEVEKMTVDDDEEEVYDDDWTTKQIGQLVTLSNLPSSRWQHLLKLDVIKARNKPKNQVQKSTTAPFFLPTVSNLEGGTKFVIDEEKDEPEDRMKSRLLVLEASKAFERDYSGFGKLVWDSNYEEALDLLKEKGPSGIEVEIQNLAPEGGGSIELMVKFLDFVRESLGTKLNYELVQSYFALFLKLHGGAVLENKDLIEALRSLQSVQQESWKQLKTDMSNAASLVGFCKNSLFSA